MSLVILVSSISKYLRTIIMAILPQITIIIIFALFVVWNGGVVLGDKSNHVATIHVPQMLYLWPYVAFFSLPVIFGVVFQHIYALFSSRQQLSETNIQSTPQYPSLQLVFATTATTRRYVSGRLLLFLAFIALSLLAVHYNTIVHPFTLADNRHYVFYVFKILRMHWSVRYLAVPAYVICAWLVLGTIGGTAPNASSINGSAVTPPTKQPNAHPKNKNTGGSTTRQAGSKTIPSTRTSFVLIWLATTTLTLITAPLVEPRYYIIPWIVWRLHVLPPSPIQRSATPPSTWILWSETAWLLLINATTGYIFLHRNFEWPQEPGVVQRFLW